MGVWLAIILTALVATVVAIWLVPAFGCRSMRSDERTLDVLLRGADAEAELARLEQQALADMTDAFTRSLRQ